MGLSTDYRPRQPAQTDLYRIVEAHLGEFLELAESRERPVPKFVRDELQAFLLCGRFEAGFAQAVCRHCGTERLVPLSCGGRGFCPSCLGRRMADVAARLVDYVIPKVPVRHWTLSLPFGLRYMLAYEPQLCGEVVGIFTGEVLAWLERSARAHGDIPNGAELHGGAVVAIHRADSAAKLNLHAHALALDGVYVVAGDEVRFVATPPPSKVEVSAVAWEVCKRTMALLKAKGLALDATPEELDATYGQQHLLADPMLNQCASASMQGIVLIGPRAGRQLLRLGSGPTSTDSRGRAAHGFDLLAGRRISADDRGGLERLCKYLLRPPLSYDRITLTDAGKVRLRLKKSWNDGTTHLELSPLDFLARLVPLVPPPKMHQVRYFGILAPHHRLRARVVPEPPPPDTPQQLSLLKPRRSKAGAPLARAPEYRIEWARLMARTMGINPLLCPTCGRAMLIRTFVTRPASIAAWLRRRGIGIDPPPAHRPRGPPQLELPFDTCVDAAA